MHKTHLMGGLLAGVVVVVGVAVILSAGSQSTDATGLESAGNEAPATDTTGLVMPKGGLAAPTVNRGGADTGDFFSEQEGLMESAAAIAARLDAQRDRFTDVEAQEREAKLDQSRAQWREKAQAKLVEGFDDDGDGALDATEQAAADAAVEQWRIQNEQEQQKRRDLAYDMNGDGRVTDAERQLGQQARETRLAEIRDNLKASYDIDADGFISTDERALAFSKSFGQMQAFGREKLSRFDMNGDGELDKDESQAALEAYESAQRQMNDHAIAVYDTDSNGMLSDAEHALMKEEMGEAWADTQAVSANDANGDGALTTADLPAFAQRVQAGDPSADVNGDGSVDALDTQAFIEMIDGGV